MKAVANRRAECPSTHPGQLPDCGLRLVQVHFYRKFVVLGTFWIWSLPACFLISLTIPVWQQKLTMCVIADVARRPPSHVGNRRDAIILAAASLRLCARFCIESTGSVLTQLTLVLMSVVVMMCGGWMQKWCGDAYARVNVRVRAGGRAGGRWVGAHASVSRHAMWVWAEAGVHRAKRMFGKTARRVNSLAHAFSYWPDTRYNKGFPFHAR